MSSICAEQIHHHHSAGEIPPRKQLLLRRKITNSGGDAMQYLFSTGAGADELIHHQKFLPFNNSNADDGDCESDDPYASDHFRMYEFKIRRCTRSRSHDWTDCPFAHPGEKARRRDPRRYNYTGTVCSDFRRDDCEFSHGVFECWLHPSRYRTEACKDGKNCKRKICFFAHTTRQLRILPEINSTTEANFIEKHKHKSAKNNNHCCVFCHSQLTSSPTSTLFGNSGHLSPPLSPSQSISPPLSPASHRYSRYNYKLSNSGLANYDKNVALSELITNLEAMNFSSEASSPISPNFNWIDIVDFNKVNNDHDQQQQFVLSPAPQARNVFNNAGSSSPDPDLGWVNDLLM